MTRLHTQLCDICVTPKPTGLTLKQYVQWRTCFSEREGIEKSIREFTADHDFGLLKGGVCHECSGGCEGIEVTEINEVEK